MTCFLLTISFKFNPPSLLSFYIRLGYSIIELSLLPNSIQYKSKPHFFKLFPNHPTQAQILFLKVPFKCSLIETPHNSQWCAFSLTATCNQPNLSNYRYIPGGLWLESSDKAQKKLTDLQTPAFQI